MTITHTHTEWMREGTTVYALNLEGSNRFVAQVQGGWATEGRVRTDDSEIVANARLIAAAPELLEALREFVSGAATRGQTASATYIKAQSAIAKATGESA